MLFYEAQYFALFLPTVICFYFFCQRLKCSRELLIFASLLFYAFWRLDKLWVLCCSIGGNYLIAYSLWHLKQRKRFLLILGIIFNLLFLGIFKYTGFLFESGNQLFHLSLPKVNWLLPLGISFFTFQQIAFLVEVYQGLIERDGFRNYILFVSFFPQLVAGPILHYKEIMPQFKESQEVNWDFIYAGVGFFCLGLFKKLFLADTLALYVQTGFAKLASLSMLEAWFTSLSYTCQIYFDFSGYSDMACGAALLFNIRISHNFFSPYKACDIQEFWRRWHITLSRWLRDYLYIPLGGNREGISRQLQNLFITFLIGGIWHGAGWNFMLWGALHGFAMVVHRLWQRTHWRLNSFLSWFLTFNFVNCTWVFFRASSTKEAWILLKTMFSWDKMIMPDYLLKILSGFNLSFQSLQFSLKKSIFLLLALAIALFAKNSQEWVAKQLKPKLFYTMVLLVLFLLALIQQENNQVTDFIYWQF